MHDGMPYGRIQGQGQGHSREVDRQSPTGLIFQHSGLDLTVTVSCFEIRTLRVLLRHAQPASGDVTEWFDICDRNKM